MLEQIPEPIKKRTFQKINQLKKKVESLFDRITSFKPKKHEKAFNGFLNTYRIERQKGYDNINLFDEAEPQILKLYKRKKKPMKTSLHLNNEFIKKDLATGEVVKITQHFHREVIVIDEPTNIEEKYREMRDTILEKVANFQPQKSGL